MDIWQAITWTILEQGVKELEIDITFNAFFSHIQNKINNIGTSNPQLREFLRNILAGLHRQINCSLSDQGKIQQFMSHLTEKKEQHIQGIQRKYELPIFDEKEGITDKDLPSPKH